MNYWKSIVLALAIGVGCFYWGQNFKEKGELPKAPELKLSFIGASTPWRWQPSDSVDVSHLKFELMSQRLHQFHESGDIGYILRYKIKTTDPAKPIATVSDLVRDEHGYVKSLNQHPTCLKLELNNPDYKFVWAEGLYTEHWKPDGEIQCVSSVDFHSNRVSSIREKEGNFIEISVHPDDGYYSTGGPIDAIPLHSVEIDFYVRPKEETNKE